MLYPLYANSSAKHNFLKLKVMFRELPYYALAIQG